MSAGPRAGRGRGASNSNRTASLGGSASSFYMPSSRSSTSCSPSCPASETGPGAGEASARWWKGLSRSALAVRLPSIRRGAHAG